MLKDKKALLFFLLPSLAGFLVFYVVPFIGGAYYCFVDDAFRRSWVGLENFRDLFRNEAFLLAMRNTLFQLIMAIFILYHIKNNK